MAQFKVGESLAKHAKKVNNPHRLEGNIYKGGCGDHFMVVQVEYGGFNVIIMESGNRIMDTVYLQSSNFPSGLSARDVLRRIHERVRMHYGKVYYAGKFNELTGSE